MFEKIQKESLAKLKNAPQPTYKYGIGIVIKPSLDIQKITPSTPKAEITIKSDKIKVSQESPTDKAFFSKTFTDNTYLSNYLTPILYFHQRHHLHLTL